MSEEKIQVFIDGLSKFFSLTSDTSLKIGTPFLNSNEQPQGLDYTGVIGISGNHKGCVYFTAPKILLRHLVLSLGEDDTSEENLKDMVGEVANTLSGNARRELGQQFVISVPQVVTGAPNESHLPPEDRSYVIPLSWKSYNAAVVMYFNA